MNIATKDMISSLNVLGVDLMLVKTIGVITSGTITLKGDIFEYDLSDIRPASDDSAYIMLITAAITYGIELQKMM